MRITWLLDRIDQPSREAAAALADADWLAASGHEVAVLSRTGPAKGTRLRCAVRQVADFAPEQVPASDVVLGTTSTAAFAARAGRGTPVHVWYGEDDARDGTLLEEVGRLPGVHHVCALPHQRELLRRRFGVEAQDAGCAIGADAHAEPERAAGTPVRVGVFGSGEDAGADVATGVEACRLASAAGLGLQLVRVTDRRDAAWRALPFAVEWHEAPAATGAILRSLDVLLGPAHGDEGPFRHAIEAMACGVPCVLADVARFRALGEGCALFVPPQDPAAMAEALVVAGRLAEVRSALRRGGLAAAARFTQQERGRALERALQRILSPDAAGAATRDEAEAPAGDAGQLGRELYSRLRAGAEWLLRHDDPARAADFLAAAHCLGRDAWSGAEAAWCRHLAGDTKGALAAFGALAAAGADDPRVHERHGLLLHGAGRAADAAQAFRAAIAAGGRSADAYNNLGVVLWQAGDPAGARHSFERALTLAPDHADARANLDAIPAA
jgi:hypothetical protein